MDYKYLIKLLRRTVEHGDEEPREYCTNRCGGCELCDQAADAIETLLAERDAVMKDLHGDCDKCRYFGLHAHPCCNCYINGGLLDYWQWRGPQKEGGA